MRFLILLVVWLVGAADVCLAHSDKPGQSSEEVGRPRPRICGPGG